LNEYKRKLEHSHHQPLIAASFFLNQHTWTDARQDHQQQLFLITDTCFLDQQ
jgi:hypothetical protein